MRRHAGDVDWMAFIDADEFMLPTNGQHSARPALESVCEDPTVGAVALNWAIYGSSGRAQRGEGLVIERFTRRAEQFFNHNHHYKSIVRCTACLGPRGNPHVFKLQPSYRYVQADGRPVRDHPVRGPGLSEAVVWEPMRLQHYVVKSREEFDTKKRARGRATTAGGPIHDSYFRVHDRNEVDGAAPDWLVAAVRAEMADLEAMLDSCRPAVSPSVCTPCRTDPAPSQASRGIDGIRGFVARTRVVGRQIHLLGWSALVGSGKPVRFEVNIGGCTVEPVGVNTLPGPDVASRFPSIALHCGFEIAIDLHNLPGRAAENPDLSVTVHSGGRSEPPTTRELVDMAVGPDAHSGTLMSACLRSVVARTCSAVAAAMLASAASAQTLETARGYSASSLWSDVKATAWQTGVVFGSVTALGLYSWDWGSSNSFNWNPEGWFGTDTGSGGADKLGHALTSYGVTTVLAQSLLREQRDPHRAALSAALITQAIMMYVEVFDGFSADHGFSYEDVVMNLAGTGLAYARIVHPGLRDLLDFRMEYLPSGYKGFRPLSDYSGQKYHLALKLSGIERMRNSPLRYFELHAGYYTRGFSQAERDDGATRERYAFVGVGLNLSELLLGERHPGESSARNAGRLFFEIIQVPYTAAIVSSPL